MAQLRNFHAVTESLVETDTPTHGLVALGKQDQKKTQQRRPTGMQANAAGEDTMKGGKTSTYARPC